MSTASSNRVSTKRLVAVGLAVSLLLAGVVSYWASGSPDGLEFVAERLGFGETAGEPTAVDSPFADYGTAGIDDPRLSGGMAGLVGVVVVAVIAFGLVHLLRRRDPRDKG